MRNINGWEAGTPKCKLRERLHELNEGVGVGVGVLKTIFNRRAIIKRVPHTKIWRYASWDW